MFVIYVHYVNRKYPYLTESELLEFQSRPANIFFSLKNRFAECNFKKHSANSNSMLRKNIFFSLESRFAECNSKNTRQTIILCRVYFGKTLGKPLFFCRVSNLTSGKPFAECTIKNTRQIAVYRHCKCRVLFAKCYIRQSLCRMFFWFLPSACGTRQSHRFR